MTALLERTTIGADRGTTTQRVDAKKGIIRDVKILGFESKNGRVYSKESLRKAMPMYEGAKVNVDHPTNPNQPRSVNDRFGWLERIRLAPDGLRGDLRFNPNHKLAARVCWDAENRPDQIGLSHNAVGVTTEGRDGRMVVSEITKINSVDLVADPATTNGLFESEKMNDPIKTAIASVDKLTFQQAAQLIADSGESQDEIDARMVALASAKASLAEAVDGLMPGVDSGVQESRLPYRNSGEAAAAWRGEAVLTESAVARIRRWRN